MSHSSQRMLCSSDSRGNLADLMPQVWLRQVLLTPDEDWQSTVRDAAAEVPAGETSTSSAEPPEALGLQGLIQDSARWGLVTAALLSLVKVLTKRVAPLPDDSKLHDSVRWRQAQALRAREAVLAQQFEGAVRMLVLQQMQAEGEYPTKQCHRLLIIPSAGPQAVMVVMCIMLHVPGCAKSSQAGALRCFLVDKLYLMRHPAASIDSV